MKVLIVGATGATGKWVVRHLIDEGHHVKAIVRSPEKLSGFIGDASTLELIKAAILDMSEDDLKEKLEDCDAVVSCLGHNLNLKGIYGKPRRLVTDAIKNLCKAISHNKPSKPIKLILMNTSGNRNNDLKEPRSIGEKIVILTPVSHLTKKDEVSLFKNQGFSVNLIYSCQKGTEIKCDGCPSCLELHNAINWFES